MKDWRKYRRGIFPSGASLVPIYLGLNVIVSLVSNKLVFMLGGAITFSSYSLVKNYLNVIIGASTLNGQNSMIYLFPKLKKNEEYGVMFYYSLLALLISSSLLIAFLVWKDRVVYDKILFLVPILTLFQIGRFHLIFRQKYRKLILFSLAALVFYSFLWLKREFSDADLYIIFCLPFVAGIGLLFKLRLTVPRLLWHNLSEFIMVSLKSWLPNTVSAAMVLAIREVYVRYTLESEYVAIYDIGLGLSAVIFGFTLSSLNLILLPKFVEGRLRLRHAIVQYGSISTLIYAFIIINAPRILSILYDEIDPIFVMFARAILVVDMLRVYNVVIGLFLFAKGYVFFSTLIDGLTWLVMYLLVSQYLTQNIFIYQTGLLICTLIVFVLYSLKIKYVK